MELQEIQSQTSWFAGRRASEYALTTTQDERDGLIALLREASLLAARLARHDRRPHPPAATYVDVVERLAEVFKTTPSDEASARIEERYRWVLQSAAALTLGMNSANSNPIAVQVAEKFSLPLAENPALQPDAASVLAESGASAPEFLALRTDDRPLQNFDLP